MNYPAFCGLNERRSDNQQETLLLLSPMGWMQLSQKNRHAHSPDYRPRLEGRESGT